jgi:hypothetical protein
MPRPASISAVPSPATAKLLCAACLAASACQPSPAPPQPGPLQAGTASALLPAPLGIGTAGFNGIGASGASSPYADRYPATTRIHGHPDLQALYLSRGEGFELILVRTDMVAVVQQVRDAILAELGSRLGRDLDHALVIGATHTHSGPGRFIQGNLYELIADAFFPAWYERLVDAVADVVEAAYLDLSPAELGTAVAQAPDGHGDRRCEDGVETTDDALPLILVTKDGQPSALWMSYAVHGTVLGIEEGTFSQDVSGAIEEHVAARFDAPLTVAMFNSWGADMAPGDPQPPDSPTLSLMPDGFDRMDRIGEYLAGVVEAAVAGISTTNEPPLLARTTRYPIDRTLIGYGPGEFEYDYGGVYCSSSQSTCDEVMDLYPELDDGCIPFPEDSPAPFSSLFTVGQLGGFHFTTWSGECSTGLAAEVRANMAAGAGLGGPEEALFFGYANDYLGYQLQEEDWWHGGYEASGSMWGPKQGEYMKAVQGELFADWLASKDGGEDAPEPGASLSFSPPAAPPLFDTAGAAWEAEEALDFGEVAEEPEAAPPPDAVVRFSVFGADPWWGAPRAILQVRSMVDGTWADVARRDERPYDSNSYGFWTELSPEPAYADSEYPAQRRFRWTFHLPLARRGTGVAGSEDGFGLPGDGAAPGYRFRVELPAAAGGEPMEIVSAAFVPGG